MFKKRLWLKIILALFFIYGIVGFFILPGIIKNQIVQNAEQVLKRKVDLHAVSLNPYTFELNINEMIIHGKNAKHPLAGFTDLDVNVDPFNLVFGNIDVKFIEITRPFVTIHKNQNCQFNFADLLVSEEKNTEKDESSSTVELPEVIVTKLSIVNGNVNFIDESGSEPFEASLTPIDFRLRDFSTKKGRDNQLSLHIEVDDGAYIDYRGKINSLEPLRMEGALELHSGRLYTQWKYFRDSLGFVVADGALDASLEYTADLSADPMQLNINQYHLEIDKLRLQDIVTKENVLKVPLLSLNGDADIASKQINIKDFNVDGFFMKVIRDKAGIINWSTYFPAAEPIEKSKNAEEKNPWNVHVATVGIHTDQLIYEENFAQEPFAVNIEHLGFGMDGITMHEENINVNHFDTNVSQFSLFPMAAEEKWLQFKTFTVDGKLSKSEKLDLDLEQVNLNGLSIDALMDKEGRLNFTRLVPKTQKKTSQEHAKEGEAMALDWKVQSFTLNNAKVDFKDQFNAIDGLVQLDRVNAELTNLHSSKGSWAKSKVALRVNKTGELLMQSKIRHTPLRVDSDFRLKDLNIASFQPYVNKYANMDINKGRLDLDFKAQAQEKSTHLLANTRISDLNLSERREGKTFFAFSKLLIQDLDFSLNPNQMKISTVDIYEPYARMKIDENRSSNITDLVISTEAPREPKVSQTQKDQEKKGFPVFIGKVNFKGGKGEFSDLSLPLPFKTDIHDLNGHMIGLGNVAEVKSSVDIDGVVDEYGLAKIKGELLSSNPKQFTDMAVKFQNIDMTNLSPYTGKFIGYKLEEGKMNVELDYKIEHSQMQGGNRVVLKRLTLGDEVESEDAISAPVGLAIALLKDSDGVIDLDVPVSGDVDAPDFAIGHVVWTAFKNLIVGIATAPFNFLGNMLGISAEELENIQFEVGRTKLLPPEREKLDKLSTALASKKMLILKIAGTYDKEGDMLAMKTEQFHQEAYIKLEDNSTSLSSMDRDDLNDLLSEMYILHFGKDKLQNKEETIDAQEISSDSKKDLLHKEMMNELIQDQKVSQIDLEKLARERTQNIISFLVDKGIEAERLEALQSVEIDENGKESEYIPTKLELGAK